MLISASVKVNFVRLLLMLRSNIEYKHVHYIFDIKTLRDANIIK